MQISRTVTAICGSISVLLATAFLADVGAARKTVPQNFSAGDFKTLIDQTIGAAAKDFGAGGAAEEGTFPDAEKVYNIHYEHGAITLYIKGVNMVTALDDLQQKQGLTCTDNKDFKDLPNSGKTGLILGVNSYSCTKNGEKDFVGYVLMIDDTSKTGHLYQVLGVNIPNTSVKGVTDRLFARLKAQYGG